MKMIFSLRSAFAVFVTSIMAAGCTPSSGGGDGVTLPTPETGPSTPAPGPSPEGPQTPNSKPKIALDSIRSDNGCLSVPSYFKSLSSMDPSTPVFAATTELKTTSKKSIRSDFRRLLAFGSLTLQSEFMNNLTEFRLAQQDGCQTLALSALGGDIEVYKITESTESMIKAQKENGEFVQYRWLSPQSIEITNQYMAFDVPCTTNNQILVQSKKVLDWSGQSPTVINSSSPFWISRDYLELAAQTVGYNVDDLYQSGANSEPELVVAKVQEMLQLPPRQDILACTPVDSNPLPPQPSTPPPPINPGDNSGGSDTNPGPAPGPNPVDPPPPTDTDPTTPPATPPTTPPQPAPVDPGGVG